MDDPVLMAALAGLLHDIGKFAQRAGEQVSSEWKEPKTQQDFGYQHALHTWHFVEKYLPEAFKPAGTLAAFHHRPKDAGLLVQIADHLSAGERRQGGVEQDDGDRKIHPRQLQSIFCSTYSEDVPKIQYLPLEALKLNEGVLFPTDKLADDVVWKKYETLWDAFCFEAMALKQLHTAQPNLESYLEAMLALMQRYTWCIPSAYYKAIPDVSLYDHSRMTAALAAILSQSQFSAADLKALENAGEPVALLIGGDISGVQDFIYTISSKRAAKTLRGRSFYLQLLTEAVARFVLARLELPYTNVIYAGGGNFFLLASPSAQDKLPAIRADLSRILLKHHGTALYLALGSAEVKASGFKPGKMPNYWNAMHKAINAAKQQRYGELGDEMYAQVFAPPEFGGNPNGTCSVCGDDQRDVEEWDDLEGQKRICSLCRSFEAEIGKGLPGAIFVALGWKDPEEHDKGTAADALAELGMSFQFFKDATGKLEFSAKRVTIWALDDPQNGKFPVVDIPATHVLHYVANQVPAETLDELQESVEGGFQKLGVIRMDVDNVGELFKHGLGDQATLSRIAALSFQLSMFFEGWIKRICERNGRKEKIYTVYTGGDDVFLLGPWDLMPVLAHEIATELGKYTARHPKITISAGMSFIGGKYPIYQAAQDAHDALEDAKKLPGKDAFYFLGHSWKWAVFGKLTEKQAHLEKIVGKGDEDLDGPQAILMTLQQLANDAKTHSDGKSRHVWGRWIWMGIYQLTRMVERAKGKSELAAQIEAVKTNLQDSNYRDIHQWGAAARWTQLKMRKQTKET
jgi:CRISPR-associated protein Csm1